MTAQLETLINAAWDDRAALSQDTKGETRDAIEAAIMALDSGEMRVASKAGNGDWTVHQWLKKAVLLGFRIHPNAVMTGGPQGGHFFDKVPSKFEGWTEADFKKAAFRVVPPATVRRGSYIAPNAVLMPSYVNIGANVGEGTMVDTWATVGSCAQIGKDVHLFVEGVIVREGAVLAMGVFISQSTKILNRATGVVSYGEVPAYSVVVPGTMPSKDGSHSLACAVIVKTVDAKTRSKTGVNELLRD